MTAVYGTSFDRPIGAGSGIVFHMPTVSAPEITLLLGTSAKWVASIGCHSAHDTAVACCPDAATGHRKASSHSASALTSNIVPAWKVPGNAVAAGTGRSPSRS